MLKIAIRVDASSRIGLGHFSRCLKLADGLRQEGNTVIFVLGDESREITSRLFDGSYKTFFVETSTTRASAVEETWPVESQVNDAVQFLQVALRFKADLVLVDHYGLDAVWESSVRDKIPRVAVIDDLANRAHNCSLLVDYNIGSKLEKYRSLVPADADVLSGSRYAPISQEYFDEIAKRPENWQGIRHVCIFLGGAATSALVTNVCLAALEMFGNEVEIRAVVSKAFDHVSAIRDFPKLKSLTFLAPLPTLAKEYIRADFAIGAGGVSAIERLALALPSATLVTADNQLSITKEATKLTDLPCLDVREDITVTSVLAFLKSIRENYQSHETRTRFGQWLLDSHGIRRVVFRLMNKNSGMLSIRRTVQSDCGTYFLWVNDPIVRANSISEKEISLSEHVYWFTKTLASETASLYVVEIDGLPIAQVRFNMLDFDWWLDYSLDADFRGQGLAKEVIRLALSEFNRQHPVANVHAKVKKANHPSIVVLQDTGFELVDQENEDVLGFIWRANG